MRRRFMALAALALIATAGAAMPACTDPEDGTGGSEQWRGTVETAGNVTTVRNINGSVWGGTATLVEELSIGVDVGEDPYMFGSIAGIWATDERIYVADYRVPAVRVFDHDGAYVMDIGREGQGPGEYQGPNSVVIGQDGRIYSKDGSPGGRVNVYTAEGESVDTLYGDVLLGSGWPLLPTRDGSVYTPVRGNPDAQDEAMLSGMAIPGTEGIVGDIIVVPTLGHEFEGVYVNERMTMNVPFAPHHTWAMSPSGAIVAGITGEYRFEIHGPGNQVTVVEKEWDPIPVDPDEAEWQRRATIRSGRNFEEAWNWDGAEMPRWMPAWSGLDIDAGGRIWIRRRGPKHRIDDCDPDPLEVVSGRPRSCWVSDVTVFEVFDEEGKFLGAVEVPPEVAAAYTFFIRDDMFIAGIEDEAGTPMVKRYRIVKPS